MILKFDHMLAVKKAKSVLEYVFYEQRNLFLTIICSSINGAY